MSQDAGAQNVARAQGYADRRLFFMAIFAHGSARALSKVASAPLERIKVCLQVGVHPSLDVKAVQRTLPGFFSDILQHQGYRGLWRGSGTHLAAFCVGGVARLGLLRTSQMWAMPGGDSHYQGLGAYARRCAFLYAAGAAALVVAYPLDVTYTCLSADNANPRRFAGVFHFLRHTRQVHGVLSFYRGFPLCLASAVPFVAIATAVHDLLAPLLLKRMGQPPAVDHHAAQPGEMFWLVRDGAPAHLYPWNLIVGVFSGFVAQTATYPLDTLRRRWQYKLCASTHSEVSKDSLRQCAERLYAEGRLKGFYAGLGVNVVKLFPELLVLSGVYLMINASGCFV